MWYLRFHTRHHSAHFYQKVDTEFLSCAVILLHAGHMKARQAQMSLAELEKPLHLILTRM